MTTEQNTQDSEAAQKPWAKWFSGLRKTRTSRKPKDQTVAGQGTVMQSHASTLGRAVAYIALMLAIVGGASGLIALTRGNGPAQAVSPVEQTTAVSQQAGDYARGFVGAWLRASAKDYQQLTQYVSVENGDISDREPQRFRGLSVASVETKGSLSTVIVSTEIPAPVDQDKAKKASKKKDKDEPEVWETAWFQVNVHHQDGYFSAVGYPAPVPAPQAVKAPELAYGERPSESIKETVATFFDAYLVGDGDVERIVHPDSDLSGVQTTPYTSVQVREVTTVENRREDGVPADGTQAKVQAQLKLVSKTGARPATYALTLEARGGRWEVLTVDPAPQLPSASSAPAQSPTQQPTESSASASTTD